MISTWHEGVYHAAKPWQGKRSGLPRLGLRGLKKACQVESQNNTGFVACIEHDQGEPRQLSGSARMLVLGLLKSSCLIALVMLPHGKDDPDPDIGKRSYGYRMAFAFGSLALVIVSGPRLAQGG